MVVDINRVKDMQNIFMIAPAGCGKTETIADIINVSDKKKRYLILTHTNAGVECIRRRLLKKQVSSFQFRIYTIAAFCSKYIRSYPILSKIKNIKLNNYNDIYKGMINLVKNSNVQRVLTNTYDEILIDEYQDCTETQHNIIIELSKIISCKLFGDPLQGIFGFNEKLVDWEDLKNNFQFAGNFNYPWRWEKNNKELGKWIMNTRDKLLKGEEINLNNLPNGIQYKYNDDNGDNLRILAYELLKNQKENLVLFQHENEAHFFAQRMAGKYYSQEEVECKELKKICKHMEIDDSYNIVIKIYELTKKCFTHFNNQLGTIYKKILEKNYNFSRISKNKNIADATLSALNDNKYIELIQEIQDISEMKIYRKELWCEFKRVLKEIKLDKTKKFLEIIESIRNTPNNFDRYKYKNLVSRILLVKGLEFDTVVLVNPENLDKKLFYVAISRPTNKLYIVSKKNVLKY